MKASRAAAKTMKSVEEIAEQVAALAEALERIEAKLDAVMFPKEDEEEKPKGK